MRTGDGGAMDDNMRFPKEQVEAKDALVLLLKAVVETKEIYKSKELVKNSSLGEKNAVIQSHKTNTLAVFGSGANKDSHFWMALIRQALVAGYLIKEIEAYGSIRITTRGKSIFRPTRVIYDDGRPQICGTGKCSYPTRQVTGLSWIKL